MDSPNCVACRSRVIAHQRGDAFNLTANPTSDGLEDLGECTTSFKRVKSYFSAYLRRCSSCGEIWLLGYYENFDARPPMAEWGERTWIWRPVTTAQIGEIEGARGTGELDIGTFAK